MLAISLSSGLQLLAVISPSMSIKIAIDRGGTFTDCIGNPGTGKAEDDVILKILSVNPNNYPDAPLEGIRRLLEIFRKKKIPRGQPLDMSDVRVILMGTTVATNALLERKGERCVLVTTKGFKDCLIIGDQTRPKIFDLSITKPDVLYDSVIEIDERITLEDYTEDPDPRAVSPPNNDYLVKGRTGETVRLIKKVNEAEVASLLRLVYKRGVRSIGVCLVHSYLYPEHEAIIGRIAKEIGFTQISLSSSLSPIIKFVSRANSCIADAYLTPEIKKYLAGFQLGLQNGIYDESQSNYSGVRTQFMQSDGGLVDALSFSGLRAILSGPAGGVVGYLKTCYNPKLKIPLIGFDMGGTSTDVSRIGADGEFEHVFETVTAGITIQAPQLDINTVAAGGGSILSFRNGLFKAGPESASSDPGPLCYRRNGPLTITDANLFLGRLVPEYFPKVFGTSEDQTLDLDGVTKAFVELTNKINDSVSQKMSTEKVALGFIEVANETMAKPIRAITEAKGFNLLQHRLVSFGGVGGQHAVAVAESLGIRTVIIHRYSSVLSAYGMALADVVEEARQPTSMVLLDDESYLLLPFEELKDQVKRKLIKEGFTERTIELQLYLNLRYKGTESSLMIPNVEETTFLATFEEHHKREFGFICRDKEVLIDDLRVRGIGRNDSTVSKNSFLDDEFESLRASGRIQLVDSCLSDLSKNTLFGTKRLKTPVYRLEKLLIGSRIKGPSIIADQTQTNVIPPNYEAVVLTNHLLVSKAESTYSYEKPLHEVGIPIDPILLSIFSHRFMDIAEQMGVSLQKTSVSTNVKERLDFSCALFDDEGNLVANAPHVPVHLGSMSTCISRQSELWKGKLKKGDVLFTNHPSKKTGGTHLPDITVITPVFDDQDSKIIFYVASRAHFSDIGGKMNSPGSMPPDSKELYEEGAIVYSELLVENGEFREGHVVNLFVDQPSKYPGCHGSRSISDNLSDLKAEIAANQKGISLLMNLIQEFGLPVVSKYMKAIQDNAQETVKNMLRDLFTRKLVDDVETRNGILYAEGSEFLDDGSQIHLRISYNLKTEETIFDFSGTSHQVYGNLNAPESITYSAIIYCLRCLVDDNIPLNQGCLKPVRVNIPPSSILCPDDGCAVVAGNVITSQRVTDVILKTLRVMAASQGDCNNFTFGSSYNLPQGARKTNSYYETIAGGHGAGPGWNGTDAVHTNMTNTRMTDVEIFEKRYPAIVHEFSVRPGSGGQGLHVGGCGVVREIEFRIPVKASILSERRVNAPFGLKGGGCGARGLNILKRQSLDLQGNIMGYKNYNLGGKNTVDMIPGDRIVLMTPGGGGWGSIHDTNPHKVTNKSQGEDLFVGKGSLSSRYAAQHAV